jgi:hypothetical protein
MLQTNYIVHSNKTRFLNSASGREEAATTTANPVASSMAGSVSDTQGTSVSTDSPPASNTGNNSPPVDTTNNLKTDSTEININGSNAATQDYSSSNTQISSTLESSKTSNTSSGNVTANEISALTNNTTVTSTTTTTTTPPVNTCIFFLTGCQKESLKIAAFMH